MYFAERHPHLYKLNYIRSTFGNDEQRNSVDIQKCSLYFCNMQQATFVAGMLANDDFKLFILASRCSGGKDGIAIFSPLRRFFCGEFNRLLFSPLMATEFNSVEIHNSMVREFTNRNVTSILNLSNSKGCLRNK